MDSEECTCLVTGGCTKVGSERKPATQHQDASAVSSYVVAYHLPPSAFNPLAAIHGYHVAFWIRVGLIAAAFVAILVLVTAGKDDITLP